MDQFKLVSDYRPSGDQPEAIAGLVNGVNWGLREQTLLGVTGSGKTFTMASVIEKLNRPTLVLAHNKTLAAQLEVEVSSSATKAELVTTIYESQFTEVTPEGTENPTEEGWYEKDGETGLFSLSEDTEVSESDTYYSFTSPIDLTGI